MRSKLGRLQITATGHLKMQVLAVFQENKNKVQLVFAERSADKRGRRWVSFSNNLCDFVSSSTLCLFACVILRVGQKGEARNDNNDRVLHTNV